MRIKKTRDIPLIFDLADGQEVVVGAMYKLTNGKAERITDSTMDSSLSGLCVGGGKLTPGKIMLNIAPNSIYEETYEECPAVGDYIDNTRLVIGIDETKKTYTYIVKRKEVPDCVKSITEDDIENWNSKTSFSGSWNDLTDKPAIVLDEEIPDHIADITIEDLQRVKNSVQKEEGKGLSTNDYTNEEKEKLSSLENYNDTEIREELATKLAIEDLPETRKEIKIFDTVERMNNSVGNEEEDLAVLLDVEVIGNPDTELSENHLRAAFETMGASSNQMNSIQNILTKLNNWGATDNNAVFLKSGAEIRVRKIGSNDNLRLSGTTLLWDTRYYKYDDKRSNEDYYRIYSDGGTDISTTSINNPQTMTYSPDTVFAGRDLIYQQYGTIIMERNIFYDVPTISHLNSIYKFQNNTWKQIHTKVTDEDIANWNAKSNFSGSYNDLTDVPDISTIETNISQLQTDIGNVETLLTNLTTGNGVGE